MKHMIDRYVYDVVRRLPDKDGEEVTRELRANIADMISDDANDEEIKMTLERLGDPALLAEQYRTNARYLIAPRVYNDYIRALKWILPMVGGILLLVGSITGAMNAAGEIGLNGRDFFVTVIARALATGIASAVDGMVWALVWTTFGFTISDRARNRKGKDKRAWTISQLRDDLPQESASISLSDSITELVVILVCAVIGVLTCLGIIPVIISLQDGNHQVLAMFSDSFVYDCIPVIIIVALLNAGECIVKIVRRRWSVMVCGTVVFCNAVGVALMIYLITRPNVFNPEFITFMRDRNFWPINALQFGGIPLGKNAVLIAIGAIVAAFSLHECVMAIYQTIRERQMR